MPYTVTDEAVRAATAAYAAALYDRVTPMPCTDDELMRIVLEAAVPLLGPRHAFTRGELVDALTRLEVRVMLTGPIAGKVNAESMADAIIEALSRD